MDAPLPRVADPRATQPLRSAPDPARIRGWQRQVLTSLVWIVLSVPYMGVAVAMGYADWRLVCLWAPLSTAMSVFAWLGLHRGWTLKLKDPALTLLQIGYSIASTAACYAIAGPMRAIALPMACLAMIFSIFALPPRQVRWMAGYSLGLYAVVMATMSWLQPGQFHWAVEVATFSVLLLVMPGCAILAQRMSALREALGRQKSELALALARVAEIAERDELTGLPNRRHAQEQLQRLQAEAGRGARAYLALIDLDHFKQVNDVHGHAVGDQVLCQFAKETLGLLRPGDLLARWGGEEFLLVIRTSEADVALAVCERIRLHTKHATLPTSTGALLRVTVSIGVSCHTSSFSTAQTLEAADAALYSAKGAGRDRVELHREAGCSSGLASKSAAVPTYEADGR